MKLTNISVGIRFSQDTGQGWKTIELGAEASVEPDDDWVLSQRGLYATLTAQLRNLWGKNGIAEHAAEGPEKAVEGAWEELESFPSPESARTPARTHWCADHQTEFRRFDRDGQAWHSHKAPDGTWCRKK